MSKYTYHITFNVSDYSEVFPETPVKENGIWEGDSWIDRLEVDEVRIHKRGNETVYATLASWIIDHTKYNTELFFQIRKNAVAWHTYVFGVRWGTIDTETGVYTVTPTAYDAFYKNWSFYLADTQDLHESTGTNFVTLYTETTSNKPYKGWLTRDYWYYKIYSLLTDALTITGLTVKSTILNNTATTVETVATTNGIVKDYVTTDTNYLMNALLGFKLDTGIGGVGWAVKDVTKITISQLLELLTLFQIVPFFESALVLRIEHIKYLLDQLQDNAVSLTLDDDEQELEFLDKSAPYMEKLSFEENSGNTDTDFVLQELKYASAQNNFTGAEVSKSFNASSNVEDFYINGSDYTNPILITGSQNQILELKANTGGWTLNENTFFFDTFLTATHYYLRSNDIELISTGDGGDLDCVINFASTGTVVTKEVYLEDRSTGYVVSNTVTLTTGVNNVTLAPTAANLDACFTIHLVANSGATVTGWATCETIIARHRVHWEVGAISTTQKDNGPFSQANIIKNWWSVYRPTNTGTQNGVAKTFTNSQFIIKRQCKGRYWPDDINMQYGINDGSHIAKIGRYTRDLDSDFVEFELLYQEYE